MLGICLKNRGKKKGKREENKKHENKKRKTERKKKRRKIKERVNFVQMSGGMIHQKTTFELIGTIDWVGKHAHFLDGFTCVI